MSDVLVTRIIFTEFKSTQEAQLKIGTQLFVILAFQKPKMEFRITSIDLSERKGTNSQM